VEFVRITYSYADEKAGKNPWKTEVCQQETGLSHRNVSLEEASAVLRAWGIARIEQGGGQPNPQGGANGRQPLSSDTNRASAAAASRRSP